MSAAELLAAYAATAERWHELRTSARAANPVFDENERLALELRTAPDGLHAIAAEYALSEFRAGRFELDA